MTEIPEHLLKRSKARKGGGDDAAPAADAASTAVSPSAPQAASAPGALAAAAAAIPADKPKPPAKPVPAYVAAYEKRKRIPVWAMPVVAALPLWGWFYAGTMQEPIREDPLYTESAALYSAKGCAGCHGAAGGGGTGYQLSGGEVLATFPNDIDQMVHVARGSDAIKGLAYGDPARPGGSRVAGNLGAMPAQAAAGLTQLELELVIFHERVVLSGEDATSEAYLAYAEELRHRIAAGEATPIDLAALLACADPNTTPEATGDAAPDTCFGPVGAEARGGH
ncbi:MAG: hypothetical protein R2706_16060 [Acidimicrobiales bacterium]